MPPLLSLYKNLKETLSFYGVDCNKPYYISSGNPIFNFPDKPFRMDFYALCICIKGSINIQIDTKEYTIQKNSFFIAIPSTIIKFNTESDDFKMKLLFFEKNFLLKDISNPFIIEKMALFQNNGAYSIIQTTEVQIDNIIKLLNYLKGKSSNNGKFTAEITRSIIFNILFEMAEIIHQHTKHTEITSLSTSNTYLKFKELLQEYILTHKSVTFYADKLNISNKYLIEIVKKASGKTPHEIIAEFLLKEAYVLLGNPELSIAQVAFMLHFNSSAAFGRFFKKHASITPSTYRMQQN